MDIDNVVARTDEVMREVIRGHSRDHVDLAYKDVVCFDYWKCRDSLGRRFHKAEWESIHQEFTRNHLSRIQPFDNVREYLERISQRFQVHLATSRLPEGQEKTLAWLEQHQIPHSQLHFPEHGQKHQIDYPFVAAVDDDREQGYAFHASGVPVFLVAHPWNEIGRFSPLRRLASWQEIIKEIFELPVSGSH